jgi:hypothetical protein
MCLEHKLKAFKIGSAQEYGGFMYRHYGQTDRQIESCPRGAYCRESTERLFMKTLGAKGVHIGVEKRKYKEREIKHN